MEWQSQCEQELKTSLDKLSQAEPVSSQLMPAAFRGRSLVRAIHNHWPPETSVLEVSKALWGVTLLERTQLPSEELVCHDLRKMANGNGQECLRTVLLGGDGLENFLTYLWERNGDAHWVTLWLWMSQSCRADCGCVAHPQRDSSSPEHLDTLDGF